MNNIDLETCRRSPAHPDAYQRLAVAEIESFTERPVPGMVRIVPACPTPHCLNPRHMVQLEPRRLNYPRGVCTYCGMPGWTKDHLLPRNWSGEGLRRYVVTVPACGECNSLIGATLLPTITARREYAQKRLRVKHAKILRRADYSESELEEFGWTLRTSVIAGMAEKGQLLERLAWPADVAYDFRAMDKSDLDPEIAKEILGGSQQALLETRA